MSDLQELVDAVNKYRQKHSESEAAGHNIPGLSDAYSNMLLVCDKFSPPNVKRALLESLAKRGEKSSSNTRESLSA
jgi:hypothetical protein